MQEAASVFSICLHGGGDCLCSHPGGVPAQPRPKSETDQPSADLVRATGKCAECHARMVDPESLEWAQWVLLLTLGGFIGNFVLSLGDHAGNGFFNPLEWVPVVASAIGVGFLAVPLFMRVSRKYIDVCAAILLLEAGVGLLGFVLHAMGNLRGPSAHPFDNFIYGAPPMAPLLFPNLMVLGVIALWHLRRLGADSGIGGSIHPNRG